jgi:hypothetical protein
MPSPQGFIDAYGPQEGAQRYSQFQTAVETSRTAFDMQTMPNDAITATVAQAAPVSSGNDAALEQKRYDAVAGAAKQILEARAADPAAYVQRMFPSVASAWEQASQEGGYQAALAASAAAQKQLGIANMQLLPKQTAEAEVATFKDERRPEGDRIAAATRLIFATQDPEQRRAVFDQLVAAGLPDHTEGAIEAMARGDEGAARRLFQAAMTDISKLPGSATVKPAEIDQAIQDNLMDEGSVGDIYYGLSDGSADNYIRAQRDGKLLSNAVNIRLRNGEDLDAAVSGAAKDLYGDVQVVTGDGNVNAQILLPRTDDPEPVLRKLEGLLPSVRSAMARSITVPTDMPGEGQAITNAVRDNYADRVLDEGYFRNAEGGFVFIDPYTGAAVSEPDGKPITFRLEDAPSILVRPPAAPSGRPAGPLTDDDFSRFQERASGQASPAAPMPAPAAPARIVAPPENTGAPTLRDKLDERRDELFENAPQQNSNPMGDVF